MRALPVLLTWWWRPATPRARRDRAAERPAGGRRGAEAREVAREIGALPAEAVEISRPLLKLPPEDLTRRIDQEGHLFGERMRSKEAVAAFKAFFARRKA